MTSGKRYDWFDLVRGLSALGVAVGHLRNLLFVDGISLGHANPAVKILYFFTGLGHECVVVFFVLSGFFVGGSVLRNRSSFSFRSYVIARLSRLWAVLIPCLLLTSLVDLFGAHISPDIYGGAFREAWHSGPEAGSYSLGFFSLLGNIFFVQGVLAPVYGSNGPLWSLAYEWWYYIIFPLLAVSAGIVTGFNKVVRVACLVVSGGLVLFLPSKILWSLPIWLLGVSLAVIEKRVKLESWIYPTAGAAAMLSGLVVVKLPQVPSVLQVTWLPLSCLIFLTSLFCAPSPPAWITRIGTFLSNISYSLYLSHFPLVVLLGVYERGNKIQPDLVGIVILAVMSASLVLVGYLVYIIFEKRTPFWRTLMNRFVEPRFLRNLGKRIEEKG